LDKQELFASILDRLQAEGCTLADFLDYAFNPKTPHTYDWRWKGFFQDRVTIERIFNHWTSSSYNKSTRAWTNDWATKQVERVVAQESASITDSGILRKSSKTINEEFFLDYSLRELTQTLQTLAPTTFRVLDAFSTSTRQARNLSEKWKSKKELMEGSAILTLLRSRSQNNSFTQAVHSTYLIATGAQRQHFGVLSTLGISMGYTSVINQHTYRSKLALDVNALNNEPVPTRKRTLGTLYLLSQACMGTARKVAASGLFVVVYDNINMMVRIAEQILGR
ncbi:hypothetical protein B0H34DRAFT_640239, partial [Crassisporium funariophilum]